MKANICKNLDLINQFKEDNDIKKIISLNNIKELNFIKIKNNKIIFGSTTPLIQVEKFILKYYPDFNNILRRYGSVQIRNVGTIGGNIATASPIGDTLPLLLSLNAKIIIQTKNISSVMNCTKSDFRKKLFSLEFCFEAFALA